MEETIEFEGNESGQALVAQLDLVFTEIQEKEDIIALAKSKGDQAKEKAQGVSTNFFKRKQAVEDLKDAQISNAEATVGALEAIEQVSVNQQRLSELFQALLEIKERQELNKKMFKGSYNRKNDDFICTDQFGELLRPNYVTQHYRLLLEKNGLRHIRFHDLRHTFASILLSTRTELIEVSKFLGPPTIATTANIYADLDMSFKEHTASVMSDILTGMNTTKAPK